MNGISLIICLALSLGSCIAASADSPTTWETHPEGVALNVSLSAGPADRTTKSRITVKMKNTSNVNIYFLGWEGFHMDVPVYIVTPAGDVALRDYNWEGGSKIQAPEIKPGETLVRTVDLSPEEAARLKGKPIKCHLRFYNFTDSKISKYTEVDSLPRVIVP